MSRSRTLYQLQEYDSVLDKSSIRIHEIAQLIKDRQELNQAVKLQEEAEIILKEKQSLQKQAETLVADHNLKIDQNQKKLYSGVVTNHKELEDLQLESNALLKYQAVLEERQLETMLETDMTQTIFNQAASYAEEVKSSKSISDSILLEEKSNLEMTISKTEMERSNYLEKSDIPDLGVYQSLRKSLRGIAVSQMISDSCSSCGSSIPSAIAQEARSPKNLASCPTCKRILYPG